MGAGLLPHARLVVEHTIAQDKREAEKGEYVSKIGLVAFVDIEKACSVLERITNVSGDLQLLGELFETTSIDNGKASGRQRAVKKVRQIVLFEVPITGNECQIGVPEFDLEVRSEGDVLRDVLKNKV